MIEFRERERGGGSRGGGRGRDACALGCYSAYANATRMMNGFGGSRAGLGPKFRVLLLKNTLGLFGNLKIKDYEKQLVRIKKKLSFYLIVHFLHYTNYGLTES